MKLDRNSVIVGMWIGIVISILISFCDRFVW